MEEAFWGLWRALFPTRFDRFLRFQWMTIFISSIGVVDLVFRLVVKLPSNVIHQMQVSEGLIKSSWFLIGYNAFLIAGFLAVLLSRKKTRYYPVRVIAFGILFGGFIGQLLVVLVPWRS
jgi:hypothetical protein